MKLGFFLSAATLLLFYPTKLAAQQPGPGRNNIINNLHAGLGLRPSEHEPFVTLQEQLSEEFADDDSGRGGIVEDERDPMLKPMPIDRPPYYYDVYVRKDISSFYGEEPGSRVETTPAYDGQAVKFINLSPFRLDLLWENVRTGEKFFTKIVGPFEAGGTSSFPNHQFLFQRHDTKEVICKFKVRPGTVLYYCDPFVKPGDDDANHLVAKQGQYVGNHGLLLSKESMKPSQMELYKEHRYNLEFATLYKNFTGGSDWLGMYGMSKPWHPMWRADYLGQEHVVQTKETQFLTVPPELLTLDGKPYAVKRNATDDAVPFREYRMPEPNMNITIRAVSVEPRAFQLDNFLSEAEVDHVIDIVKRHSMKRSTTGSVASTDDESCKISDVRTSRNTWVARDESAVLDAIYRRVADALRLDESLLRRRASSEPVPKMLQGLEDWRKQEAVNEHIQVVHYGETQEYTAHHDFGYEPASRSINLCLYLNEGMKGGETSFVRWRNAETDQGLDMKPEKGKAMIFYMVNPDGNRDDLSAHAARPVTEGEKYFANLWIWDPYRL